MGVTASAMLAAANRNPDAVFNYNFLDFLTLYVVSFVLLDVFAPAVVRPALTAHASIRRGVKLSVRFLVLGVASLCKRPKQLEIHRAALRLGILDELPTRFLVLKPSASPPMVHPVRRSKDPELLKAVADAHQAAKESSRYADEAASQADELEEKLGALATSMEVHVMNKLEGKLRAISDMAEAQCEAANEANEAAKGLLKEHSGPRVVVNTTLVDERIDKRFEDMEQMLKSSRGTRVAPRGSMRLRRFAARPTSRTGTRASVSSLSDACAKGWNGVWRRGSRWRRNGGGRSR